MADTLIFAGAGSRALRLVRANLRGRSGRPLSGGQIPSGRGGLHREAAAAHN